MGDMKPNTPGVRILEGYTPQDLPLSELIAGTEPVLLKGLVRSWNIVAKGIESDQAAIQYLAAFDSGKPVPAAFAPPDSQGRLYYNDDLTQLNFQSRQLPISEVLRLLEGTFGQSDSPGIYVASALIDRCLPGFRRENDLALGAQGVEAPPSIWIGNRITASCHYDVPHNIACCVIGRRRFTLFPPEQISNLYPGPLDPTPGGQAISLVDFSAPDLARFPRFAQALEHASVVELAAGDALYIPSLWWHHVQGLNRFNVLVNYWWKVTPKHIANPVGALQYAMWTLRNRPEAEKQAWKAIFDYYVFGPAGDAADHLPAVARGILGPIDETRARQIRAQLINDLNR
jgi:hypothetical protein